MAKKSPSLPSGKRTKCPILPDYKAFLVHLDPAEFTILQLAGEIREWPQIFEAGNEPKWWTSHWDEDGHYLCNCGKKDKEPKTL